MRQNTRLPAAAIVAACFVAGGCSSDGPRHAGDIGMLRSDPSPAMHTLAERDSDRLNRHAIVRDTNFRMLSDDIDRLFMIDRPSHLSFYPKTY